MLLSAGPRCSLWIHLIWWILQPLPSDRKWYTRGNLFTIPAWTAWDNWWVIEAELQQAWKSLQDSDGILPPEPQFPHLYSSKNLHKPTLWRIWVFREESAWTNISKSLLQLRGRLYKLHENFFFFWLQDLSEPWLCKWFLWVSRKIEQEAFSRLI